MNSSENYNLTPLIEMAVLSGQTFPNFSFSVVLEYIFKKKKKKKKKEKKTASMYFNSVLFLTEYKLS